MDEARSKVLQMLADGKLNVEEAERLLDRLASGEAPKSLPEQAAKPSATPKYLRVVIDDAEGSKVNVRVPVALLRAGVRMGALIPERAREKVEHTGLDLSGLSKLNPDGFVEALCDLDISVDGDEGETVRVFCE